MRPLALLALALGLAGCEDTMRSAPPSSPLVDAFEDGNVVTPADNPWQAVAQGPNVGADVDLLPGGWGASSHYLSVSGVRGEAAGPGEPMGVRVDLARSAGPVDRNRSDVLLDAAGFEGVAFALRGTPGTYIVQIGSAEVTDGNFYNA